MVTITVLRLAGEGASATVSARRADSGAWEFWHDGGSIFVDDDAGIDGWKSWTGPASASLAAALPDSWQHLVPLFVAPEFAAEYERVTAGPRGMLNRSGHARWRRALGMTTG